MKVLYIILAIMFLLFALLQWNDPDPLAWIILYGYMAVICLMAAWGNVRTWPLVVGLVCYGFYALLLASSFWIWITSPDKTLLFDEFAKMQNQYIEETREFLGLLICLGVLATVLIRHQHTQKSKG